MASFTNFNRSKISYIIAFAMTLYMLKSILTLSSTRNTRDKMSLVDFTNTSYIELIANSKVGDVTNENYIEPPARQPNFMDKHLKYKGTTHSSRNTRETLTSVDSINKADIEQMANSTVVDAIRENFIEQPSRQPYNLLHSNIVDPSAGQPFFVDKLLQYKTNGFFIECGAYDGEYLSNTLFFERYRNWTGLLIEADPDSYKAMKTKHRKALTLNTCLSESPIPSKVTYRKATVSGMIVNNRNKNEGTQYVQQQCFPIYSILLAINRMKVDYFSLDVEGSERRILDTIPWKKVDIKVMSIESVKWKKGKKDLANYMKERGYKLKTELKSMKVEDMIFIKQ